MTLPIGQTLNGRYRITQALAQGGFGATYLAEDLHLPDHPACVVKQLKPQMDDPESLKTARRLFATEAQILYELGQHDRIPQLFAYFEEQQEFYLVEDYIRGQNLREEIRQQGKLSQAQVLVVLKEMLEILAFVHGNNVIHRDINPSNIIRSAGDRHLSLIDFGAVKRVTTQLQQSTGQATVAIGTQGYIPSEQAQGRPQFVSDLYAVGMVAIEALTGQFPHTLSTDPHTAEILWRNLVTIDVAVGDFLDKMIRHDFRERFTSVHAALTALQALEKSEQAPRVAVPTTSSTVVLTPQGTTTQTPSVNHQAKSNPEHSTNVNNTNVVESELSAASPQPRNLNMLMFDPEEWRVIVVLLGLGFAALLSVMVSLNLGWQWWSNRQESLEQYRQGQLYQERGEPENALASYQEVLNQRSKHEGALLGKAQVLQQLQRYDGAIATYDTLLKLDPENWQAWWGLGQILSDRQQYNEALKSLNRALQGNNQNVEIWQTKTEIHLELGENTNALESLAMVVKLDSKQSWAWHEMGWIYHQQQQYKEAIETYDRALRGDNDNSKIWYRKGNSYFQLAKYQEARNAYERVVKLEPNNAPAWYKQGEALEKLEKYRDAQTSFQAVVNLEPNNAPAWSRLAGNAQRAGDRKTAIEAYRRTINLKSDDHSSWVKLAGLYYASKEYADAIAAYDQALALKSQDGNSWKFKGNSHFEMGDYEQAIAAYDQALQYKSDDEEMLANRQAAADILERRRQKEERQEEIKEGLEETAEDIKEGLEETAEDIKDGIKDILSPFR